MAEASWLGGTRPRPDAPDKATGKARYIHDIERPGMLHGRIKFSAHPHARIVRVDASRARRLRGVAAVLTGADVPEVRYGFLRDNVALKRDRVRCLRDEVAAVAAVDRDVAAEALELIEIEYEPLPGVFTTDEALREGAPLVHETDGAGAKRTTNVLPLRYHHESGDLAAARRASAFVVEGKFTTPRIQQSCLGTAGCIAELDASGHLTVWAKTQIPFLAQRDFARALEAMGLHDRRVRVVVPTLGGGFGTGLDTHGYEYIAILLAHRAGRPVKIVYDRADEFARLSPRQCAEIRIRQGCDAEGHLTLREIDVLQDNGAYAGWGATYPTVMMLPATSLYRVGAIRFDATVVYTNNPYCQAMRGYGNPELTWALESNLDELADAAGLDPLALRLLNCNEPGETSPMGLRVETCGLRECLTEAARLIGSDGRARDDHVAGRARGIGIASLVHVGGSGRIYRSDGSGMHLKLDDYGGVTVHYGGVEMGQGLHAAIASMVAEGLGVRPEQVFVDATDTATCPWDVGTHASRGAFMAGNAALLAARALRTRLFALAEDVYPDEVERNLARRQESPSSTFDVRSEARRDRFELRDGWLSLAGAPNDPAYRIELGRLLRAIHFRAGGETLAAEAFYEPPTELPDFEKGVGNMSAAYAYGAQAVEVEVDEDTGTVKIVRVASVHDVGRVIDRNALAGQVYGGLAQGVGYALMEQVLVREGAVLNAGFTDYRLPNATDLDFPVDVAFVETNDPSGPFGAKGIGEPGLVPTAPAIANAVQHAVGVRIRDLPITAEKVLAALEAQRREGALR